MRLKLISSSCAVIVLVRCLCTFQINLLENNCNYIIEYAVTTMRIRKQIKQSLLNNKLIGIQREMKRNQKNRKN